MIEIAKLTEADIGRWVEYQGIFAREKGKIKSFNSRYIFVVYKCDNQWDRFKEFTAVATMKEDLEFVEGDILL